MINQIKTICKNLISNERLTEIKFGVIEEVTESGEIKVRLNEKLLIPANLILLPSYLPQDVWVKGNAVVLLENHGGQQFFVLDVMS